MTTAAAWQRGRHQATYLLPLRWRDDRGLEELTDYLTRLREHIAEVLVVDGSPPALFDRHRQRWTGLVRHLPSDPWPGRNGKVAGVMTGLRRARQERVVIADDDVRYDPPELARVVDMLGAADAVRPQNYFCPMPWHARWDTARSLLNRALGTDYPGTLGVRRSRVLAAGGYDGDVLFENYELLQVIREAGGVEAVAADVFVRRRPPTARHFLSQRVRQAYDSLGQPGRLAVELALLPALVALLRPRGNAPRTAVARLGLAFLGTVAVAERGRRRDGGARYFPAGTSWWAPAWVLERAVCSWLALARRACGGVPYYDGKIVRAVSTPTRRRRARDHPVPAVQAD